MSVEREAALAIAGRIRAQAIDDGGLLSWPTVTFEGTSIVTRVEEDLYSGVAGIALLFLELGDFDTATGALRWLERHCDEHDAIHYGYYTGRLGVVDVFVRAFEISGERRWLDVALRLARRGADRDDRRRQAELLAGHAGSVLALLRLHAHAADEWIERWIDRLLGRMIDEAHLGRRGLYWDRSLRQIRGLCGLSHGASGCGLAFLEAGRYFDDPALLAVAELAFAYEHDAFEANDGNWPDYRIDIETAEGLARASAALDADDRDFFTRAKVMNAWCHGAIGIGFVRLRACEILGQSYRSEVETAIAKTRSARFDEFMTVCHGSAGAMAFLAAAGDVDGARAFAEPIADAALRGLPFRSGYRDWPEEDFSLFMGSAGIAYALLTPRHSVFLPVVRGAVHARRSIEDVARRLAATRYPRTVAALGEPLRLDDLRGSLERFADPAERALDEFDLSLDSCARVGLLEMRRRTPAPLADDTRLRVSADCAVASGRVLVAGAYGARDHELGTLAAWLVERFGSGDRIGQVVDEVASEYGDAARAAVQAQIRELVSAGILC